jgi:hypothetical protein
VLHRRVWVQERQGMTSQDGPVSGTPQKPQGTMSTDYPASRLWKVSLYVLELHLGSNEALTPTPAGWSALATHPRSNEADLLPSTRRRGITGGRKPRGARPWAIPGKSSLSPVPRPHSHPRVHHLCMNGDMRAHPVQNGSR